MRDGPPMHRVMDAADRAEERADRKKDPARQGRGQLSSMDLIPEEGQEDIVWAVGELNKREKTQVEILFELNDRLAAKGIDPISKSAFNRRSVKLAALTHRLDEARYLFSGVASQFTAEKVDESSIVVGEFIKTLCFELTQGDAHEIKPKGAMELARAHLAVIQGQAISAQRRAKLQAEFKAEAAERIKAVVQARGLSSETAEDLKRQLFGVPAEAGHGA